MGVTDPRKLIVILRDLEQELERWSGKASDMVRTAQYAQNIQREQVERTWRHSRLVTEQYNEDEAVYRSRKQNVHDLVLRCDDNVQTAQVLVSDVETKLNEVKTNLEHWTNELEKALEWQRRAQARLARAERELAAAQQSLASAERELSYARDELRRCQNSYETDSQGRRYRKDCSGPARRVERAVAEVNAAQRRVQIAQIEVNEARAELDRATRRVRAYQSAVQLGKQARDRAEESLLRAQNSLTQAERALDSARSAERGVELAGERLETEGEHVDQMNVQVQYADDRLSEALVHLNNSLKKEESAQRYRIMARADLLYRVDA
ncbi:MAG: hypothetical protein K8L99_35725, partial [Anaerolineae bacterium]|nr:hypothetical protein [Anaerolineae bacterium]